MLRLALIFLFLPPLAAFSQVPSVQAWEQVIRESPEGMCNRARRWNAGTGQSYNTFLVGNINENLQQGNTTMANSAIAESRLYLSICRGVY